MARKMEPRAFPFRFTDRYRHPARLFGITPANAFVSIVDSTFTARFGPWKLSTPTRNIANVSLTGPYHYLKTVGPARLSLSDRGLTFATNNDQGVFVQFWKPVPGLDPMGLINHPNLTVTVADCPELIAALRQTRVA